MKHYGITMSIIVVSAIVFGASTASLWYSMQEDKPTCEKAEQHIWAFRQCLNNRPSCEISTVESFAQYHETKYWAMDNCPEEVWAEEKIGR